MMVTPFQVFLSRTAVLKEYYVWGQFCILGFVRSRLLPEASMSKGHCSVERLVCFHYSLSRRFNAWGLLEFAYCLDNGTSN